MNGTVSTIAVIFDFDDTLVPDSTTLLLEEHGVDSKKFWKKDVKKLISAGYDPTPAYLKLLLDNIGKDKSLGPLTNNDLRKFGANLDNKFYVGLPGLFSDLRKIVKRYKKINLNIEFFIISGGLQEIIEGSKIVKQNFKAVYACRLAGDTEAGVLKYISRCVTFTEKTRFLFEINKGLDPKKTRRNPFFVNQDIKEDKRPVPFKNMIYVGDGNTDIPCFSVVGKMGGGQTFGVFNPDDKKSAKKALQEFLIPDRVISVHAPRYRKNDELGSFIRSAVATRCNKMVLERKQAEAVY